MKVFGTPSHYYSGDDTRQTTGQPPPGGRGSSRPVPRRTPRILLTRLRLIGDVVFTTPAIAALRSAYPDAELVYLVEPEAAPVVRANSHLDQVVEAPRRRGLGRLADDLRLLHLLRGKRFDIAIDFHGGPRSAWITYGSGARVRIGYALAGRSWMYTTVVPRARELRPRHSVENQWDLVAALAPCVPRTPDPRLYPTEMAVEPEGDARLAALDDRPWDGVRLVIHVSAGNPFRRWPAAAFEELAVLLLANGADRRIILTSGPSDAGAARRIADEVRARLPAHRRGAVQTGEIDLATLRLLIERSALFIGGDSGPLHIASTTRTPVVAIFGPTLAARSAPWRDPALVTELVEPGALPCRPCEQRRCVPGDFRCLAWTTPGTVAAAAERALARSLGGPAAGRSVPE